MWKFFFMMKGFGILKYMGRTHRRKILFYLHIPCNSLPRLTCHSRTRLHLCQTHWQCQPSLLSSFVKGSSERGQAFLSKMGHPENVATDSHTCLQVRTFLLFLLFFFIFNCIDILPHYCGIDISKKKKHFLFYSIFIIFSICGVYACKVIYCFIISLILYNKF